MFEGSDGSLSIFSYASALNDASIILGRNEARGSKRFHFKSSFDLIHMMLQTLIPGTIIFSFLFRASLTTFTLYPKQGHWPRSRNFHGRMSRSMVS